MDQRHGLLLQKQNQCCGRNEKFETCEGVTKREKLRNSRVRAELIVIPLWEEMVRNKMRWYRHVMRMGEERLPKKYLSWRHQSKRPVGRPRKIWLYGEKEVIEKRGSSIDKWSNCAYMQMERHEETC